MEDVGFGLEKRSWKSKEVAIRCVCVRVRVCVGGGGVLALVQYAPPHNRTRPFLVLFQPGRRSWYCSSQAGGR